VYLYYVCGRCRSRYSPDASTAALAGATALVAITYVAEGNTNAVEAAVAAINVTMRLLSQLLGCCGSYGSCGSCGSCGNCGCCDFCGC
jgi:hypothetical protein